MTFPNNRGVNFDLLEDGEVVLRVRYLTPREPIDCVQCGKPTLDTFGVPYYCGVVREGCSEGGYAIACLVCYQKWQRWNDLLELLRPLPPSTWRPVHGGYPGVRS